MYARGVPKITTTTVEITAVTALKDRAASADSLVSAVTMSATEILVNNEVSGTVINIRKIKMSAAVRTVVLIRDAA